MAEENTAGTRTATHHSTHFHYKEAGVSYIPPELDRTSSNSLLSKVDGPCDRPPAPPAGTTGGIVVATSGSRKPSALRGGGRSTAQSPQQKFSRNGLSAVYSTNVQLWYCKN